MAALEEELGVEIDHTGWLEPDDRQRWLAAATVAVQLRPGGRGEASGAVGDCLAAGVATVVNDVGSHADVPAGALARIAPDPKPRGGRDGGEAPAARPRRAGAPRRRRPRPRRLGAAALASPAAAHGAVPDKLKESYNREYRQARHAGGDPGRNIVRLGVRDDRRVRAARTPEVRKSIGVLERMQLPAPAPAAATGGTATGGLAAVAECESGGDPTAVSPDGRYRGKYQFDQQTW